MAIDRTAFDLWVDDDGSGLTGTVLTKERMAEDILDPIDAALTTTPSPPTAHGVTHGPGASDEVTVDSRGTWTPAWDGASGASGMTYTTRTGTYVKTGHLVTCFGYLLIGTMGTISGQLRLSGLPFTSRDVNMPGTLRIAMPGGTGLTVNTVEVTGLVIANSTAVSLWRKTSAAATSTAMVGTDLQAGTEAWVQIEYQID